MSERPAPPADEPMARPASVAFAALPQCLPADSTSPAAQEWPHRVAPSRRHAAVQLLVAASILLVGLFLLSLIAFAWLGERLPRSRLIYVDVFSKGVLALLAVVVAGRPRRGLLASVGLGRALSGRAIAWGLVVIVPCYVINVMTSLLYVWGSGMDVMSMAEDKMRALDVLSNINPRAVLPLALFVGVYEEIVFRGFLFSRLGAVLGADGTARRSRMLAAAALSAAVFGLAHVYQGPLGMLQTFSVGFVLALVAAWFGSIWPCIVAHMGIDSLALFVLPWLKTMLEEALRAASQPA